MKKVKKVKKSKKTFFFCSGLIISLIILVFVGFFLKKQQKEAIHTDDGVGTEIGKTISLWPFNSQHSTGFHYSISSSNQYATEAGVSILEAGGNAVDAAIAMSYTLAVAEPYASGLGGGGCMLIYDPESEHVFFYNYASEAAKSGASSVMLVPGFVSGMESIRKDFSTLSYQELLQPAIECCDGIVVDNILAGRIDGLSDDLGIKSVFYKNGDFLQEGDTLIQNELKDTLLTLEKEGADSFYTGSLAQKIVRETPFTEEDLASYRTICDDPVVGNYCGYKIASAAAPYSGVTLLQMLRMSEMLNIPSPVSDNRLFLEQLEKISLSSHSDRLQNVYDLRFAKTEVDQEKQITAEYLGNLLNMDISEFEDDEECEDTTAFTITDQNGMIVACTNTISSFFGCKKEVGGFYLNNSGMNFGSGVNAYKPGKRPRSHIAPTILISENEVIAVASPGGNVIIKTLFNILTDVCRFDTDPQQAIEKKRLIFTGISRINYEVGYTSQSFAEVSGMGYRTIPKTSHTYFGNVALAGYNDEDGYYAVSDPRRNGCGKSKN